MASHYDCIATAIDLLVKRHAEVPSLEELSGQAGLSLSHFQRLFTEFVGISPKRFSQHLFLQDARERLQRGEAVLDAALGSGLSGPGRLHHLTVHCEAVTPGEQRSGGKDLRIEYDWSLTPFGWGLFGKTSRGLCYFALHETASEEALAALKKRFPAADLEEKLGLAAELCARIFSSEPSGPIALHLRGTNFQIQVWQALMAIPDGLAASYGSVARKIDRPKASRAVGTAVGNNPVAILIPCHRVLRESGAIGGYRWGLDRKRALLAWERARPANSSSVGR
jgi:AraC family transcriptional regulator of adaptative response/methylated-DNA-[protein]-cysteine methyltransferase|tara:strand:+ start:2649 stop:3491 length:843 start_codon:yes stop_codon:yes gene_type:complete